MLFAAAFAMPTNINNRIKGLILGKQTKDLQNPARLKELMTARPMTAERHAEINRKRIRARRMLEDAREMRNNKQDLF